MHHNCKWASAQQNLQNDKKIQRRLRPASILIKPHKVFTCICWTHCGWQILLLCLSMQNTIPIVTFTVVAQSTESCNFQFDSHCGQCRFGLQHRYAKVLTTWWWYFFYLTLYVFSNVFVYYSCRCPRNRSPKISPLRLPLGWLPKAIRTVRHVDRCER